MEELFIDCINTFAQGYTKRKDSWGDLPYLFEFLEGCQNKMKEEKEALGFVMSSLLNSLLSSDIDKLYQIVISKAIDLTPWKTQFEDSLR